MTNGEEKKNSLQEEKKGKTKEEEENTIKGKGVTGQKKTRGNGSFSLLFVFLSFA